MCYTGTRPISSERLCIADSILLSNITFHGRPWLNYQSIQLCPDNTTFECTQIIALPDKYKCSVRIVCPKSSVSKSTCSTGKLMKTTLEFAADHKISLKHQRRTKQQH